MTAKIFAWLTGLALVLVFLVVISPDLFRGYVFSTETRDAGGEAQQDEGEERARKPTR